MYRLQTELDTEPSYIYGPGQIDSDEPLITIAPGNADLARWIVTLLNKEQNNG